MSMRKIPYVKSRFLLPAVVTLSLLLALTGMGMRHYAGPSKNKLSHRDIVEIQAKENKKDSGKAGKLIDCCVHSFQFAPTVFYTSATPRRMPGDPAVPKDAIPARAPPAARS